jgi:hypothetical protein
METLIALLGSEAAAFAAAIYALFSFVMVLPTWRVFRRAGLSAGWSLMFLLPLIGPLLVLALLAFAPWRPLRPGRG